MRDYRFRIVNVFAEERLDGNPLAVFENALGIDDATMQALALQFNLSETTFILPSDKAMACVRIFTPSFEMPFAGHPTLGTAHVIRALHAGDKRTAPDHVTLEMLAGVIPVDAEGARWTLRANAPKIRPVAASADLLAAMLRLTPGDFAEPPLWVDTGSEQLVVPLASVEAVARASPDALLLAQHARVAPQASRALVYIWARKDAAANVVARFFFMKQSQVVEDPGTGSACANLGGYLLATKAPLPISLIVDQGAATGRRCTLGLAVDAAGDIRVSGRVVEIAQGVLTLEA